MRLNPFARNSAIAAIGVAALVATGLSAQAAPKPSSGLNALAAKAITVKRGPGGGVIVLLKNHTTSYNAKTSAQRSQAKAARSSQQALVTHIKKAGGSVSHSYTLINAVAAKVSQKEANALAADKQVQEVIPDQLIKSTATASAAPAKTTSTPPPAGTCDVNGKPRLEPEALELTRANSDVPGAKTARSLGYTGKGVTVGYMADGIDINNPDFKRNGKSIFTDYQDFTSDGLNAPTDGAEAFIDAGAIAAQGKTTYDVSHFGPIQLNQACHIRIEGEAPGVNLVGLKIFDEDGLATNSSIVQAIQYAATVDHVNIFNESLGSNPYPDDPASLDAVKAANDAAVAQGVTITVSTGDAGVTNTIGSPATDPKVISTAASTAYRFDATTGYGGYNFPGVNGWLNNNISSLSSGGFAQDGRTVDLTAPGELAFAPCSKNLTKYEGCVDPAGGADGVERSGGTSESAPVTAGVAALVVEAYRAGHGGSTPTPAVVKTILTSTADDIQAPADQQGAGLVDAYKAVQLAKSYNVSPRTGHTISSSASQFSAIANPHTAESFTDTITNQGTTTQTVHASARTLGGYSRLRTTSVTLSDAKSSKILDFQGAIANYEKLTFSVPAGENRLNASIAFQNASPDDLNARVRLTLVDPQGRLASYSVPQGDGNYGNSQVTNPVGGTWTAYIWSKQSTDGGTEGKVLFAASAAEFGYFGSVSPSTLTLAPGQSGQVKLSTNTKNGPGDKAGALVLTTSATEAGIPATTSVPVTLRSLIPTGAQSFTDTLTGGNGRSVATGQTFYYNIDVANGTPELNANVTLADDPTNTFFAYLISPDGEALATGANQVLTTIGGGTTPVGAYTLGAQLHALAPPPGRWTLIVLFAPQVSGTAIKEPFTVATDQTKVPASASGLPNSANTTIKSGTTKTVNVKVKNTGNSPEAFFVDPRLSSSSVQYLAPYSDSETNAPFTVYDNLPEYLVPTQTTALGAAAQTSGPADIQFDMEAPSGDPDLLSDTGKTVTAGYSTSRVSPGVWDILPTQVGPFTGVPQPEPVDTAMVAQTRDFDPSVSSSTGDLWLTSVDPNATLNTITVDPGDTATIPVHIHATGKSRTVHGTLYVDDAQLFYLYGGLLPNGNEVAALPYTYTIK